MSRNGAQVGVVQVPEGLEGLMEALAGGQPQKRKSREQQRAEAKEAFEDTLNAALDGACPGNADPAHRAIEENLLALFASSARGGLGLVPEPIEHAVFKLLAFKAMHEPGDMGDSMKRLFDSDTLSTAMLVAGAVLRVKDLPDTTGIARTDGRGQYL